ncbi:MAG: ABC transporter substrate-binding protein [Thermogutta sp.]|nr:ABC transporter substrate-binding protein [Thermogutta sp.]
MPVWILAWILLGAVTGCGRNAGPPGSFEQPGGERRPAAAPRRVVSLAPSITETLFALGMGDRVVGVTDFCRHPPEATALPKVGGYLNPSVEAVLRLRPDLVVVPAGTQHWQEMFSRFSLPVLEVDHRNLEGVFASFETLGRVFAAEERAREAAEALRARLDRAAERCRGRPRPRVLLAIDRTIEEDRLRDVYVAGDDGFLDQVIELAGGENAAKHLGVPFPVLSAEGILRIDPDVIVDLVGDMPAAATEREVILSGWKQVAEVKAVRTGRVYILSDVPVVPGPRTPLLVERLARCFHPEVEPPAAPEPPASP